MRFKLTLLFALAVIVLGIYTYRQLASPFSKGELVHDFSLINLQKNTVQLNELRGQVVMVHFWATWCPKCLHEFPQLNEFAGENPEIKVLAVSEDEGGEETLLKFFAGNKPNFDVLLDPEGLVADKYESYMVPETYLISKNGKFLRKFSGPVDWNTDEVGRQIKHLLGAEANNN